MKSAVVEREARDADAERRMVEGGLGKYPTAWKMWLMLGQLEQRLGKEEAAREAFTRGLRRCPTCMPLWRAAAALEARGLLDKRPRTRHLPALLRWPFAPPAVSSTSQPRLSASLGSLHAPDRFVDDYLCCRTPAVHAGVGWAPREGQGDS